MTLPVIPKQTAYRAEPVDESCAELAEAAEPAIEQALAALAGDFPETLAQSIVDGVRVRIRAIERTIG